MAKKSTPSYMVHNPNGKNDQTQGHVMGDRGLVTSKELTAKWIAGYKVKTGRDAIITAPLSKEQIARFIK